MHFQIYNKFSNFFLILDISILADSPNPTNTIIPVNQSYLIKVHFKGTPEAEDMFRSTVITLFNDGTQPSMDRKHLSSPPTEEYQTSI